MATVAVDQRLEQGCYLSRYDELWQLLGKELDDSGAVTGKYVLEAARGEVSQVSSTSRVYVHRQISATATEITRDYKFARGPMSTEDPTVLADEFCRYGTPR